MTNRVQVKRYPTARAFLAATEATLLLEEVENNLMLGIACGIAERDAAPGAAEYFAAVLAEQEVVGCAFRSVSDKIGITRIRTAGALLALAVDAGSACTDASSVGGPEPTVATFAELLAASTGRHAEPRMAQRIHELRSVVPPQRPVRGRLRPAGEGEIGPLTPWVEDMLSVMGDQRHAGEITRERIQGGHLFVWDDDGPVSMAAWTGKTATGVRVNFVYTPPELRGRGYASASVAALSQRLLDQGNAYCCLYTDLANATSNAIYRRIGYRPVCDAGLYGLRAGTSASPAGIFG
jgi:GNAT superfamily N-acetyltransferase